ncbi:hypothetical protein H671_6g15948 [Cricetulus griseus]|uniref:Uncharacterized protein n=1 Tax=Cricetulus griseus TaxID=10029 RepID=A0A061I472_CRIGR|nr:hypothetical protein H671_6g15948 [Cricetulus griseus]
MESVFLAILLTCVFLWARSAKFSSMILLNMFSVPLSWISSPSSIPILRFGLFMWVWQDSLSLLVGLLLGALAVSECAGTSWQSSDPTSRPLESGVHYQAELIQPPMLKLQLQKNIGYYSYFQFSRLSGQETYDSRLQHLSEMVPAAPAAPAAPGRGLLATDFLNEEMFSTETLEPSKSL